jgi:hypothetical protein
MGDALGKVQSGEKLRIPAAAYNAFIDTALDLRRRQQTSQQDSTPQARQTGIILVRNDSGADRGRFDVLGVSGVVITPTDNPDAFKSKIALIGASPAEAQHAGRFVVLLEPIAASKIGQACASGVTIARVDVVDTEHQFADVSDGSAAQLKSAEGGAGAILWKESGTGVKWAVVRIGAGGGAEAEPIGMYPGMVHQVVAANTGGWDWEHAHSLLP